MTSLRSSNLYRTSRVYIAALDCYVCSYLDGDSDASCVNNASAVRVLNCTKKYCLTVRLELKVRSFI